MSAPLPTAGQIADFLGRYPPFAYVARPDLQKLGELTRVRQFPAGQTIFRQGEKRGDNAYVIYEGLVRLGQSQATDDGERPIEVCDEGDLFGAAPLLRGHPYRLTATVVRDATLYLLPRSELARLIDTNERVALYFAAGLAAGHAPLDPVANSRPLRDRDLAQRQLLEGARTGEAAAFTIGPVAFEDTAVPWQKRAPVTCQPGTPVAGAARLMADANVGSIVICDDAGRPLGIVTDTDLRKQIATGVRSPESPVESIMSTPVLSVAPERPAAEILIQMIRTNVRHLVVTPDGTDASRVIGIVSEHDLLVLRGDEPAVLVREIYQAGDREVLRAIRDRAANLLRNCLASNLSVRFVAALATEINDALIRRAIEMARATLAQESPGGPGLRFAWIALGSEGRKEQLLRTDQDNALIYEDPPEGMDEQRRDFATRYFARLSEEVVRTMMAAGFAACPAEMMASNPKWRRSASGWRDLFHGWINRPHKESLLHAAIFFDLRAVEGDPALLLPAEDEIYGRPDDRREHQTFLRLFAHNVLKNPPPLGFFRSFVLERDAEHRDRFDIKLRGMMPLCEAARILALIYGLRGVTSTIDRFEAVAALDPRHAELAREAAYAYSLMMQIRALSGFRNGDSGRYIDPAELNKIERQSLKGAFRTVAEVQTWIRLRFQLDLLPT